jgi:hypothetical protein
VSRRGFPRAVEEKVAIRSRSQCAGCHVVLAPTFENPQFEAIADLPEARSLERGGQLR